MFLLRKYMHYSTFRNYPDIFLQTVLDEGGTALSHLALNHFGDQISRKSVHGIRAQADAAGNSYSTVSMFISSGLFRCFATARIYGV